MRDLLNKSLWRADLNPRNLSRRLAVIRSPIRMVLTCTIGLILLFGKTTSVIGDDFCNSTTEGWFVSKIRAACQRATGRQPYRPFADHFPKFHPVPVSPVFPSLYDPGPASRTSAAAELREPREPLHGRLPKLIPEKPIEMSPLPAPKQEENPGTMPAPMPRQASRSPSSTPWIFLPAAQQTPLDSGSSQPVSKVASHAERIAR